MDIGMPFNPDFNSGKQEGAGLYQTTTKNGRRCSAAVGYLKPVLHRKNLNCARASPSSASSLKVVAPRGVEVIEKRVERIDAQK